MQDFTGVPAVADLAAMREALKSKNVNPEQINPITRVDLVIDHSVMVDKFGNNQAYEDNVNLKTTSSMLRMILYLVCVCVYSIHKIFFNPLLSGMVFLHFIDG